MEWLLDIETTLGALWASAERAYEEAREVELSTEEATDSMEREYAAGYRDAMAEACRILRARIAAVSA